MVMMRRTATAVFLWVFLAGSLLAAQPLLTGRLDDSERVVLDRDNEIFLSVRPQRGDAWTRLALRTMGDASRWKDLAELNGMGPNLMTDRWIKVPLPMVRPSLQVEMMKALFPADRITREGWMHKVVAGSSIEGESFWKIAEWFAGDGAAYAAIRTANRTEKLSTRKGDWVLVPTSILSAPFRTAAGQSVETIQLAEDDPESPQGNTADVLPALYRQAVPSGPVSLEYHREADRPYAVYRLQKGEALYSSVVIRFTGRLYARDVNEVVDQLVGFNRIEDVSRLPVGYAVRIPMELLTPEFRSPDDPTRIEHEQARRESLRLAKRVEAKDLDGVQVILDPGHGGRDVGTIHNGIWESTYVYDVACRLKEILEKKSGATVWMTTKSADGGYRVVEKDRLEKRNDHVVLTTPRYQMDDPIVGVNLRWYLANSIFRRAMKSADASGKIVFISIHADSLHPSLRGAMAYIPGERFVQGTYEKDGPIYLARAEVKEHPTVTQTREDALRAEGLSTDLAQSIMDSFEARHLPVHPFQPIRGHVVRNGKEWVPAVIRYNKIPSRLLLEICNLGNPDDRELLVSRSYRNDVAQAIYSGLVEFFESRSEDAGGPGIVVAAASR